MYNGQDPGQKFNNGLGTAPKNVKLEILANQKQGEDNRDRRRVQ